MKKPFHIVIALCIGLMLGSVSTAFASDTVQATFQKFVLKINGQKPVEIEPLTYRGTTYLPVREAANKLGYDVTYKADDRTIELRNKEGAQMNTSEVETSSSLMDIDREIERLQHVLMLDNRSLEVAIEENMGDVVIQNIRNTIAKTEQDLADLERQKAELEAQK